MRFQIRSGESRYFETLVPVAYGDSYAVWLYTNKGGTL
ncbi:unnamed protein product [Haemonchus placei]|uniref:Alpha/beta hydrolase n=1 Tax=Haemonchus placei TaxID=6290 RepID=A0A0N4W4M9_HAEPC|nr:unnamed protein product [Haemonchus placei]